MFWGGQLKAQGLMLEECPFQYQTPGQNPASPADSYSCYFGFGTNNKGQPDKEAD